MRWTSDWTGASGKSRTLCVGPEPVRCEPQGAHHRWLKKSMACSIYYNALIINISVPGHPREENLKRVASTRAIVAQWIARNNPSKSQENQQSSTAPCIDGYKTKGAIMELHGWSSMAPYLWGADNVERIISWGNKRAMRRLLGVAETPCSAESEPDSVCGLAHRRIPAE